MTINTWHDARLFASGIAVATVLWVQPAYCDLVALAVILIVLRRPLVRLVLACHLDLAVWRLERQLEESLHADCDCSTAFEYIKRR